MPTDSVSPRYEFKPLPLPTIRMEFSSKEDLAAFIKGDKYTSWRPLAERLEWFGIPVGFLEGDPRESSVHSFRTPSQQETD